MLDDDDTVKDLAIKTMEELWFPSATSSVVSLKPRPSAGITDRCDKGPLQAKVAIIMGVSANFKDRQSPLEDMLHKIMAEKEAKEASFLHARYVEICEALIDSLVDASDLPGFVCSLSISSVLAIYLQKFD